MGEGEGAGRARNRDNLLREGSAARLQAPVHGQRDGCCCLGRGVQAITSLEKGWQEKVSRNRDERVWVVGNVHGFPLGEEGSRQREAQPAEGVVQLEAQVHHDPVKCHFCTYGI